MKLKKLKILLFVLVVETLHVKCSAFNDPHKLDIASFNVQVFGRKKMEDAMVRTTLPKIIRLYDLILIQEIRDSTGRAIVELLQLVNANEAVGSTKRYKMMLSERLGRSSSKEQYAMIYRVDWLEPTASYTYADPNDVFERQPFVVRFKSYKTGISDFAVMNIHTSPADAQVETSHLVDVYDDVRQKWQLDDVLIMGDFNADCKYINKWKEVKLATDKRFYWLIDDTRDTTTKSTDCTYDRIIVAGEKLIGSIVPLSANVLHYDQQFHLTQDQAEDLSDHYPVSVQIESTKLQNLHVSFSFEIRDGNAKNDMKENFMMVRKLLFRKTKRQRLAEQYNFKFHRWSNKQIGTRKGKSKTVVEKTVIGVSNAVACFEDFNKAFGTVVSEMQISTFHSIVKNEDPLRYVARGYGRYQTLYDYYKKKQEAVKYTIRLVCNLVNKVKADCWLVVA